MFSSSLRSKTVQFRILLVSPDSLLGKRLSADFASDKQFKLEVQLRNAAEAATTAKLGANCATLVIDMDPREARDIDAVKKIIAAVAGETPIIILSEDLGSEMTRRLLHLQVADWLPRSAAAQDIRLACERAVSAKQDHGRTHAAKCIAFYPALGGVGTTTLAVASAFIRGGDKRKPNAACLIDLDLQSGTLADHLDLQANLQLEDIVKTPERLDAHLLEIMLSRHATGISLLAAPNSLAGFDAVGPEVVTRLLDLAASRFDNLVIDMPRHWLAWSEGVLKGADRFFVTTELSVPGLRQARRVADELQRRFDVPVKGRVIVNKVSWLGGNGVKKSDAYEALGERLAGFVGDAGAAVAQAHNRGALLSELNRASRLEKDLTAILVAP